MNETYTEHLVKRKTPIYIPILTGITGALTLLFLFLSLTSGFLSMILMFIFAALTYMIHLHANVEYEYLYIGGQLTIDRILGRSRRKKAWEGSMEQVEIIAPTDSYVLKDHKKPNQKHLNFSSAVTGAKTYTMLYQSGMDHYEIILEPSEKMIQNFRQNAPRKVIQ